MSQTIGQLRASVAAFLQGSLDSFNVNGNDLLLNALNNARRNAEKLHDWDCQLTEAYGVVSDGKGTTANWKRVDDDSTVKVKQVQTYYLRDANGCLTPLYAQSRKHAATWAREHDGRRRFNLSSRYPGDAVERGFQFGSYRPGQKSVYDVYVFNRGFELHPKPVGDVTIQGDVFCWLDNYSDDADTDFFTEHGSDYLMYAAIVECNLLVQTFIPQQEGNLSPPQKAADTALAALIAYDKYIVASSASPE